MRDLVNFVNKASGNIDPIILAGIFHKQFVVIHPFTATTTSKENRTIS